jgi:drug/metabolite transporter (DMT)-like permease
MAKITKKGLAISILYVLMSVTLAEMTKRITATEEWKKPLLTCWFNHCFLIVLWPVLMVQGYIGKEGGTLCRIKIIVGKLTAGWPLMSPDDKINLRFSVFMIFLAALFYSATGGWVEALQHASVTDIQALQKLIPIFTIIFAFFLLGERISKLKLIAVAIALSGVAVLSFSATRADTKSMDVWGVIFGCSSAVMYALYSVIVKKAFGDALDENASIVVMFLLGLATIFPVTIVIPLNDQIGLESFAIPGSWHLAEILCLNAFVAVLCNLGNLASIALNGPTFTTIFATSQIAIAAVVDYILDDAILSLGESIGCLCILFGCVLTVVDGVFCAGRPQEDGYQKALTADDSGNNIKPTV